MDITYSYGSNPITKTDYPDPDVIFADGVFYMISTTMHFLPGGEILRSYDLINWEHCSYVFDRLDSTDAQRLKDGKYIYGKGMWAATLRYHEGTFYVVFVCNDTHKTYLYRANAVEGPWTKSEIEGFYHDCSLLFDEGRAFLVYGNTDIWLTELNENLAGPKEGGLHRLIVSDKGNPNLGYEGSHIYKIFGRYYLFLIHSRRDTWRRTEACFSADSLEGEFTGGDERVEAFEVVVATGVDHCHGRQQEVHLLFDGGCMPLADGFEGVAEDVVPFHRLARVRVD